MYLLDHLEGADASNRPVPSLTLEPKYYPGIGRCIYCGALRYSATRERLAAEHIIPEAIGGQFILQEASCGKCEGRINWFEHYCNKELFGPLRYKTGFPSKRRKKDETVPIHMKFG